MNILYFPENISKAYLNPDGDSLPRSFLGISLKAFLDSHIWISARLLGRYHPAAYPQISLKVVAYVNEAVYYTHFIGK